MTWEYNHLSYKKFFPVFIILCLFVGYFAFYWRNGRHYGESTPMTSIWVERIIHPSDSKAVNRGSHDLNGVMPSFRVDYGENLFSTLQTDDAAVDDADPFGPVNFDINGSDVMVFLHMQKTGGTEFGRQLVKNMILPKECDTLEHRKRRNCLRPNSDVETWIFSRFSTGWKCGLHSDWTELHECVAGKLNELEGITKDRKYFYVALLREPIKRFLSEWRHVQRGATWKDSLFSCRGEPNIIPHCYQGVTWEGVSLKEFMACPQNMGVNRQTRMLADLRLVNCYQRWLGTNVTSDEIEELEDKMLESAMKNLQQMTFFGLVDEQVKMQKLFEYTFPFKFKEDFVQYNVTKISSFVPSEAEMETMKKLNNLDIKLYDFALNLFLRRYEKSVT